MKKTDPNTIALKYAKALFDLAQQANQVELILAELNAINKVLVQTGAARLLSGPGSEQIWSDLKVSFEKQLSPILQNFVRLLEESQRYPLWGFITKAYQACCDQHFDVARGTLVTATQIDQAQVESMQAVVTKKIGKKVIFEHRYDPSILGGVVAHVGGWTFDDSLKMHLAKLNQKLVN